MCRAFGAGDFSRLVEEYSPQHDFVLTPAIPEEGGQCPYHINASDPKMHAERACEYERITLCAMDGAGANVSAAFLQCMDRAPLPLAYNNTWPRNCALGTVGGSAWQRAAACFSGARGDALLAQARRATALAASGIPSVQVNGTT